MKKQPNMPTTLPKEPEATVFNNPNLQVYSEELKAKISDDRIAHLKMARIKMQKMGKADMFENSSVIQSEVSSTIDAPGV